MILKLQEDLNAPQLQQLELLRDAIKQIGKVCIAYSGGVDSSLIAAIAKEQLGTNALAVTGVSDSLAPHLRKEAQQQAAWIGIKHTECITNELESPDYNQNPVDRCFACKQELHTHLANIASNFKESQVIDGVNFDDLGDHRPGIQAARLAGVRSPLAELKIRKSTIRDISKALGFPWWDKPSQPCLASRFPYGESISSLRLAQVAKGEQWLIDHGFSEVRVRIQGLGARIELPVDRINDLLIKLRREELITYFLSIGFTSISVDLEGLISGKLNRELSHKQTSYKDEA
ncbi:ATP-dependent sacrificial sulfur transferase LarE [Prochlorococcus marinus]|uniref:ATP-utilizing enzymes of the PP-loop superfamily n=1 Tax=Prochlorococcus marinus (strain MIT 9211) TaxID=93059 RepID=A9BCR0_PROM4|nr:ATP-dependent sacrificial sulfur transferase LarE [Prochlorococcus marinus]ABX09622.1 ATP-utilizing enzymes of the PP-loop superfamily [Prochlorococcus marinus str. MIT 9211]